MSHRENDDIDATTFEQNGDEVDRSTLDQVPTEDERRSRRLTLPEDWIIHEGNADAS